MTQYSLSYSESRVKSNSTTKGMKHMILIAANEFQMYFQRH